MLLHALAILIIATVLTLVWDYAPALFPFTVAFLIANLAVNLHNFSKRIK